MDSAITIRSVVGLILMGVATTAVIYSASRILRGKGARFKPNIGFTRLDGWSSVALLLENNSEERVWAEEIEIALTDLIANQQCSEASLHEVQKINQTIREQDMLPVSLVETIYKAAGRPQRNYSCIMSSIVRYRIGEKWHEEPMKTYRLRMVGLTVSGIRREKRTIHQFKSREKASDVPALDAGSK